MTERWCSMNWWFNNGLALGCGLHLQPPCNPSQVQQGLLWPLKTPPLPCLHRQTWIRYLIKLSSNHQTKSAYQWTKALFAYMMSNLRFSDSHASNMAVLLARQHTAR